MVTLLKKLYRTRLLTIPGLYRMLEAIATTGINLMALLRVAAKLHPQRTAVIDDQERLSYAELWRQAETLAGALHIDIAIQAASKKWRSPAGIMRRRSRPFSPSRAWGRTSFSSTRR